MYKYLSFIAFIFFINGHSLISQDTLYLKTLNSAIKKGETPQYYQVNTSVGGLTVLKKYNLDDHLLKQESYKHYEVDNQANNIKEGFEMNWYDNGQLKSTIQYKDNLKNGPILTYWENGQLKRKDSFKNNEFVKGECFDEKGKLIEHFPYMVTPQYKNGTQDIVAFLQKELRYPKKAKKKGIQGHVIVSFNIDKEGVLEDVKVHKGVHKLLDDEAVRVVNKMTEWKPGQIDGEAVKVNFSLPVSFKLN